MVPLGVIKYIVLFVCFAMDEIKRDYFLDVILAKEDTPLDAFRVLCVIHAIRLAVSLLLTWILYRIHCPIAVLALQCVRTILLYNVVGIERVKRSLVAGLYVIDAREYLITEFTAPRYRKSRLVDTAYSVIACAFVEFYRTNVRSHPLHVYDIRVSALLAILVIFYGFQLMANQYCLARRRQSDESSSSDVIAATTNLAVATAPIEIDERSRVINFLLEMSEQMDGKHDGDCGLDCCNFKFPTPSSILSPDAFASEQSSLPTKTRLTFAYTYHTFVLIVSYLSSELTRYNLIAYILYVAFQHNVQFYVDDGETLVGAAYHANFFLLVFHGQSLLINLTSVIFDSASSPKRLKFYVCLALLATGAINVIAGLYELANETDVKALVLLSVLLASNELLRKIYAFPYLFRRAMDHTFLSVAIALASIIFLLPFYVWRLRLAILPFACASLQLILFVSGICLM